MSYERCSKCCYSFGYCFCSYEKERKEGGKIIYKLKDNVNCAGFKEKQIKEGKWKLDIRSNKLWTNICNTCCLECDYECEEHCNKVFRDGCSGCELDK